MIKNLLFDLGGVLLNLNRERCVESFRTLGAGEILEHITDFSHKGVFGKIELGTISTQIFCEEIKILIGKEVTDEQIINAWNSFLLDIPLKRIELLQSLKQRYRIFLLSNTNEMHIETFEAEMIEHYGVKADELFDKLFYSCRIGMSKPNPEIFDYVLKQAGILPEETVFFDDSALNIEAALKKGIHGINILPSEELADYDFEDIENNIKFVSAKKDN